MRLPLRTTLALLILICAPVSSRAESSAGKVFQLRPGLELKILELRRTKEQAVMFRYSLTNSSTQDLGGEVLGFDSSYDIGAASIALIDMQSRKKFGCMKASQSCVGSKRTTLAPGKTREFWVYMTEPPATSSSVVLQVGDNAPHPVTIDPAQ